MLKRTIKAYAIVKTSVQHLTRLWDETKSSKPPSVHQTTTPPSTPSPRYLNFVYAPIDVKTQSLHIIFSKHLDVSFHCSPRLKGWWKDERGVQRQLSTEETLIWMCYLLQHLKQVPVWLLLWLDWGPHSVCLQSKPSGYYGVRIV